MSIVTSFVPLIVRGMNEGATPTDLPVAVQYVASFFMAIPLPFLIVTDSPVTVLIIAFGLWQAWKQTRRPELNLSGPYYVNAPQPAPLAGTPALG